MAAMKTEQKLKAINKILQVPQTDADREALLSDLLTESEIDKIHERVQIVECLQRGLSQRETSKKSGAAIATVTRGAGLMKKPGLVLDTVIQNNHTLAWWHRLFWGA